MICTYIILIIPLLSYNGTSSCGIYPSFTRLALRQVPSGLCEAGINLPKKYFN